MAASNVVVTFRTFCEKSRFGRLGSSKDNGLIGRTTRLNKNDIYTKECKYTRGYSTLSH